MFELIKQFITGNSNKLPDETKPSPEIKVDYVYHGVSKEEYEFYQNEKNDTWKRAEQLIGTPIKFMEIKTKDIIGTNWGTFHIHCTKHIYAGEILCVDGGTVKYKTIGIDHDGNRIVCIRHTCLHDNQKYAIITQHNYKNNQ